MNDGTNWYVRTMEYSAAKRNRLLTNPCNMEESQKHQAEQKKPDERVYTVLIPFI